MTQMDQHQTHLVSAQQQSTQQQQQHIITKHLNNASAIVQKVIPRNILVSGRIQNKIEVKCLRFWSEISFFFLIEYRFSFNFI